MEAESRPEYTSDDLTALIQRLSVDQVRFIVARQGFTQDKEAAEAVGLKPATVKQWKRRGVPIDDAVRMMAFDGVVVARELRRKHLAKAMAVKVAGLDADNERVRQNVSTEIIEWEMGKAAQPITGADGGALALKIESERERLLAGLADKVASLDASEAGDVSSEPQPG